MTCRMLGKGVRDGSLEALLGWLHVRHRDGASEESAENVEAIH